MRLDDWGPARRLLARAGRAPRPLGGAANGPGAPAGGAPRRLAAAVATELEVAFLYLLMALGVMAPWASDVMPDTPAQDLLAHVSGIVEVSNALAEGQFPARVAPRQADGERYPFFQFYCQLPYTAGGLIHRYLGADPYAAWKIVMVFSLVLGAYFLYRCGYHFTGERAASVLAGGVFMTAPYMMVDVHARVAFPEAVAFNLLPAVLYFSLRSFARPGWPPVLAAAVAWNCVALTHAVFILFGSLFVAAYFLLCARPRRDYVRGMVRVGAGYGLGLLLAAWYLAPQFVLKPHIVMALHAENGVAAGFAYLSSLPVLLAPAMVLPQPLPPFDNERFGLQVGWPILAALLLLAAYARHRRGGLRPAWRGHALRLAVLFLVALTLAWSPAPLWKYLPRVFNFVLFPYRFLAFCVLWGSLLAGVALAVALPRRRRLEASAAVLLLLGASVAPYLGPPMKSSGVVTVARALKEPFMGGGGGNWVFQLNPRAVLERLASPYGCNFAAPEYMVTVKPFPDAVSGGGVIPALSEGDTLRVEGHVPDGPQPPSRLWVALGGRVAAECPLGPGPFRLEIPVDASRAGTRVPVQFATDRPGAWPPPPTYAAAAHLGVQVTGIRLLPAPGTGTAVLPAEATRPSTHYGRTTLTGVRLAAPALVQLPVLYYPRVLRVEKDGRPVAYANLDRYVAVPVEAGEHVLSVRYQGIPWANHVSRVAWALAGVLAVGVLLAPAVSRRGRGPRPPADPGDRNLGCE